MKKVAVIAALCAASLFLLWGCSGENVTAPAPTEDASFSISQDTDGGYLTDTVIGLEDLKAAPEQGAAVVGPDVAITSFTATPQTVQPGDVLTLSATVANLGGTDAVGPFDVWMGVLGTNFEFARVTVDLLPAGQSASGSIDFTVPAKRLAKAYPPGTYRLYCVHDFPDTNSANDYKLVDVTLEASTVEADLAVSKSVDNGTPTEGEAITYTVAVTNNGPEAASGVEITDNLPAGLTFQSSSASQGTYAGGIWSVGSLALGSTATLTITANVNAGTAGQIITNTAAVSALNETDPVGSNDSAAASILVQAAPQQADLAVSKTVDNPTPTEGDVITYTITVNNNGPQGATGVEITDVLPTGVTFQSSTATQGSYAGGIWTVGALADSAMATLDITATVNSGTAGGVYVNTASVSALNETDPDATNDSASVSITVQAPPTGTVVINAEPNEINAPWTLVGPGGTQTGNGDLTLSNMLTGDYTITWEPVAGYDTPAGETLTLNQGQVITFLGTYVFQTSEAFGLWLDPDATLTCTTAAFLDHVPAYIIYSDPSLALVRGFEAGIDLSHASGGTFNTSISVTYPTNATDVGVSDPLNGTYNYIVGYADPIPTSANTVMATLDIFFLEFDSVTMTMRASDPESPPITGQPAVVKDDFNLLDVAIGNAQSFVMTGADTCAKSMASAGTYDSVRSLYR